MRLSRADIVLAAVLCTALALSMRALSIRPHGAHVELLGTGAVLLEGRIVAAPDIADTSISYVVGEMTFSGSTIDGRVLVRDRRMWPRHAYAETVRLYGTLAVAEREGYGASLRSRGIHATMYGPSMERVSTAPRTAFGTLVAVREAIEGRVRRLLPEPQASLAVGLLTGTRASFPAALTADLRTSGLTHIVAISGSNVAIILVLLENMFFWIPRRWRLAPLLAGIAVFVLFTGASASVVRAGIMGGLGLMALHAGRVSNARRTLLWTGAVMVLWNPLLLTSDLGFQLSFLSVLGILEVSPFMERFLARIPNVLALRESVALTLSSQVMAAPWIAYALGNASLVALPANLLAGPLVPWAMLLSALALPASLIGLGLPVAFLGNVPLTLIIRTAEWTAAIPFASLDGMRVPPWIVTAYYVLLGTAIVMGRRMKNPAPVRAGLGETPHALRIIASADKRPAP